MNDKIQVGSELVSGSGVEIKVTDISITKLHLITPHITVSYDYNDNGNRGSETVGLTNFLNNMAE